MDIGEGRQMMKIFASYINAHEKEFTMEETLNILIDRMTWLADVSRILAISVSAR